MSFPQTQRVFGETGETCSSTAQIHLEADTSFRVKKTGHRKVGLHMTELMFWNLTSFT